MAITSFPAVGSHDWYAWAQDMDSAVRNGAGSSIVALDTDLVPYFDPAGVSTSLPLSLDTDLVPYYVA